MSYLHGVQVKELTAGTRPIEAVATSVIGIVGTAPDADATAFPANTPVLIAGKRTEAAKLDTAGNGRGTLPQALDAIFDQAGALVVVIRVEEGADAAATQSAVIGGTDAQGNYTGIQALLAAKQTVKVTPRILCAPGFDHITAVTTEFVSVAEKLRAIVYAAGPNTTDADAITHRQQFDSKRLVIVDPWCRVWDTASNAEIIQPASARIAGLRAKLDLQQGFWYSISNNVLNGISGIARHVDFAMGDETSRANLLNKEHVTTIIQENGFRVWGPRTTSTDTRWHHEAVVRIFDVVADSIQQGQLWAVDQPINAAFIEDVAEGVNAFLRDLKGQGAIIGGECYADAELNTAESLALGKVYFKVAVTPVYVAEQIEFGIISTNEFLEIV